MLKTLCGIYSQAVLRCPITVSLPTGKTWNTLNNVNYHLKMKIVMIIFSYRHHWMMTIENSITSNMVQNWPLRYPTKMRDGSWLMKIVKSDHPLYQISVAILAELKAVKWTGIVDCGKIINLWPMKSKKLENQNSWRDIQPLQHSFTAKMTAPQKCSA